MMRELIAPGSSTPMLRSPMMAARPRRDRLRILRPRAPGIQCVLEAFAQALPIRILRAKSIADRDQRIEHCLVAVLGTPAALNGLNAGCEEFFKTRHVEPRLSVHSLAGTHECNAVERTCSAADILDERAPDMMKHILYRRITGQLREPLLRSGESPRHIESVVSIPCLCVQCRQIIFLRHNCGNDRIHRITNICHLRHTSFPVKIGTFHILMHIITRDFP